MLDNGEYPPSSTSLLRWISHPPENAREEEEEEEEKKKRSSALLLLCPRDV